MTAPSTDPTPVEGSAPSVDSLADLTARSGAASPRRLWEVGREARIGEPFGDRSASGPLAGRSVVLKTTSQLDAALGLLALDGVAARIVLCPPDLDDRHLAHVVATTQADAALGDEAALAGVASAAPDLERFTLDATGRPTGPRAARRGVATQWLMFTSGTTGAPKIVIHDLARLTGAFRNAPPPSTDTPIVWGTFYDIRRYGGLQILLRALLGGASMALSSAEEDTGGFLRRLARLGVTHLSGTPSHWRRALMRPEIGAIAPRYVRLSGEIADQALLDQLKAAFPASQVGHAYASTEAGVGFEVTDGLEGVPAAMLEGREASNTGTATLRLVDGALQVRSSRAAYGYVGQDAPALIDDEGFVDTGDIMQRRGDRLYFVGRRDGVINVGGLKVHPEEVEAVINRHPQVRSARAYARRSPITGAVVAAEIVPMDATLGPEAVAVLTEEVLRSCRAELAAHKAPVRLSVRDSLPITIGGKLDRRRA